MENFDKKFESFLDTLNFSFSPPTKKEEIDEKYNEFLERIKERYCYTGFIGDYKALEKNHTISDYENWKDSKDFENFVLTFNLSEIAFEEVFKEKELVSFENSKVMNDLLKKYEIDGNTKNGKEMLNQIVESWNSSLNQRKEHFDEFKISFPYLSRYIVSNISEFEQIDTLPTNFLETQEETLLRYYETNDIKVDKNTNELYSESGNLFSSSIISLAEGEISFDEWFEDASSFLENEEKQNKKQSINQEEM